MSREIEFEPNEVCDICGAMGAFDFYGDLLCAACAHQPEETSPDASSLNIQKDQP